MTETNLFGDWLVADHERGLVIDIFAGGGGASTGIEWALGRSPDYGLNHSLDALRNHALNHPEPRTRHICDDIRKVSPRAVARGRPVELLWASPDCRHFSRAKGGKPCNPKIRALPWEVVRWARETKPRLICVENVPEMQTWGPLYQGHSNGCSSTATADEDEARKRCTTDECHFLHPIPELAGQTWEEWLADLRNLGYVVRFWVLYAHHYGAGTSRKRLVVVARRDGIEPVCPPATHGPGLLDYVTAASCIDWSDLGESIFDPVTGETRHAEATLRRIATGVMRFVVEAAEPFIVTCNHGKGGFRGQGLREPFKTICASHDAHGLVVPTLIASGYGERPGQIPRVHDIQEPHPTVVAGGVKSRLVTAFLAKHYGGVVGHEVTRPLGTITATDHHSLVAANLIRTDNQSDGRLRGLSDLRDPVKTITTSNGHALVAAFMSTYYGTGLGRDLREPMPTQTTKHRFALVTVVIDGVTYVVTDIRMRMLKPDPELKRMQGFPRAYRLEGSQKLKCALVGNSVPPQLTEAVVRANTPALPMRGKAVA